VNTPRVGQIKATAGILNVLDTSLSVLAALSIVLRSSSIVLGASLIVLVQGTFELATVRTTSVRRSDRTSSASRTISVSPRTISVKTQNDQRRPICDIEPP
jgi:hypothetical protein